MTDANYEDDLRESKKHVLSVQLDNYDDDSESQKEHSSVPQGSVRRSNVVF